MGRCCGRAECAVEWGDGSEAFVSGFVDIWQLEQHRQSLL